MTDSQKLNLILEKMTSFESDMQEVKQDVGNLKTDMQEVKQDVSNLKDDMQEVKQDVSNLKDDMQEVKQDVSDLKQDVGNLKTDMQEVKQKVAKIDLTLDNEIRINIQRVAEGHLDLSRNLHDAMKPNNEIEMLAIKVRMLEADVEKIKHKIS